MAGSFADAYVRILPKMADFGAELKRALGGLKNVEVPVSLRFDAGKITQQLADLSKPQQVTVSAAADVTSAAAALAPLSKPIAPVVAPLANVSKAKGALDDLAKAKTVQVEANAEVARAKAELDSLSTPLAPGVVPVVDDAAAIAALAALERALTVQVEAKAEVRRAKAELAELTKPMVAPIEVRLDAGTAQAELSTLTRPDRKTIEVEYVTRGGGDPYASFTAAGETAGKEAGGNLTAGLTGALAGGMKGPAALLVGGLGLAAITSAGGDFQVAMEKIRVQTGATAKEMAAVDAITLQLGKDQKLGAASAGDAATAIQVLSKGQFSLKESTDIARSALQLSIVSQQDAATATGQLATSMAQLKIPVGDAVKVVDALAAADLKGIIGDAGDYATAIQYAGTSWTQSFKDQAPLDRMYDLQTALVTLDNQAGITGSAAGTTIRRMMIDMTGPTRQAKEGIGDLTEAFKKNGGVLRDGGTVFVTAAGQMRPLTESIDNLDTAFKNMNPQQVMDLLEPVFTTVGKEGVALLRDGRESWDEYRAAIMRSGLANELADAQAVGLKGAFSGLAGALETTAIQTAKAVSPLLVPALGAIGTAVSGLGVIIPPAVAGIGALFTAIGDTAAFKTAEDLLGRLKRSIGSTFEKPTTTGSWMVDQFLAAQTPASKFQTIVANIRREFPLVDQAAKIFETKISPAISAVAGVITGTLIPAISSIVGAVTGLVGPVVGFFAEWDLKAKIVAGALTAIGAGILATTVVLPAFTAAVGLATAAITGAGTAIAILTSPVTLTVAAVVALAIGAKLLYDNFEPVRVVVDAVWQAVVKLPGPTWLAVAAVGALGVAAVVATGPIGLIALGVAGLVAAVGLLANNSAFRDFAAGVGSGIATALGFIDGFKLQVQGIVGIFQGVVSTVSALLRGDFSAAWDGVKQVAGGFKDLILGIAQVGFGPLIGAIRLISPAWSTVKSAADDVLGFFKRVGAYTFGALGSAIRAIGGWFLNPRQAVSDFLQMLGTLGRYTFGALGAAIRGIAGFFTNPKKAVSDFVGLLKQIVSKAISISVSIPGMGLLREAAGLIGKLGGAGVVGTSLQQKAAAALAKQSPAPKASGQTSGRAKGGPVEAGVPYLVGEEGPELFFPKISGEIMTNPNSARFLKQAKDKSFDPAGVIAKLLVRTPGDVIGTPTDRTLSSLANSAEYAAEALVEATEATAEFVDGVEIATGEIGDAVSETRDDLDTASGHIVDNAKGAGQRLTDNAKGAGDRIVDNAKTAGQRIADNAKTFEDEILVDANEFGTDIAGVADDLGTDIVEVVDVIIVPAAEDLAAAIGDGSPLGDAIGELGIDIGDLSTDLGGLGLESLGLAFDTLANTINLNTLSALDSFALKLNSFDFSGGGGGGNDGTGPIAVDGDGNPVTPNYIVPPPAGPPTLTSPDGADLYPTGGPLSTGSTPNPGTNGPQVATGGGGVGSSIGGTSIPQSQGNGNGTPAGVVGAGIGAAIGAMVGIGNAAIGALRSVGDGGGLLSAAAAGDARRLGSAADAALRSSGGSTRTRGDSALASAVGDAVREAMLEAGIDRPNVTVSTGLAIPHEQLDTWAEVVAEKVDAKLSRGR